MFMQDEWLLNHKSYGSLLGEIKDRIRSRSIGCFAVREPRTHRTLLGILGGPNLGTGSRGHFALSEVFGRSMVHIPQRPRARPLPINPTWPSAPHTLENENGLQRELGENKHAGAGELFSVVVVKAPDDQPGSAGVDRRVCRNPSFCDEHRTFAFLM
jgi:hypothetical protein